MIVFFYEKRLAHSQKMNANTPLEKELFELVGKLTLELQHERENVKKAEKMEKLVRDQLEFERKEYAKVLQKPSLERSTAKSWPPGGIMCDTNADNWGGITRDTNAEWEETGCKGCKSSDWLREGVYLGELYEE